MGADGIYKLLNVGIANAIRLGNEKEIRHVSLLRTRTRGDIFARETICHIVARRTLREQVSIGRGESLQARNLRSI